tara:strand:+ start:470 stop:799 length:330 start_codon:yes stop_codon:yes gene_type:complete
MKNIKYVILGIIFFTLFTSCGVIKDGFSLQKKDSTDEFLVEKKNPLKLPPDFDELPVPKSVEDIGEEQKNKEIKSLLTNSENNSENVKNNTNSTNKKLQDLLLDKIKKN